MLPSPSPSPRRRREISACAFFAATGVTDGTLLSGVKFYDGQIETHTVIMRSATRTVRWIYAEHMDLSKFERHKS